MRNADLARLARYGISGGASALTHFGVLVLLAEVLHVWPVAASTAGFVASIVVSYLLQKAWVFRSDAGHGVAGARFLTVTAVAFGLNTGIVWVGTEALRVPYPIVQAVALGVIPVVNYTLNSRWTFRPAPPTAGSPPAVPLPAAGSPPAAWSAAPPARAGEPDQPAGAGEADQPAGAGEADQPVSAADSSGASSRL